MLYDVKKKNILNKKIFFFELILNINICIYDYINLLFND